MSLIERKVVLTEKDSEGNTVMNFPVTRAEYVEDAVLSVNGAKGAVTISAATQSAQGLMSAADKKKLDGIAEGANKYTYTLPTATASTKGGVTIGDNITVSSGKISLTKSNVTTALGYTPLETAPVTSVNGKTGAVSLTADDVDALPLSGGTMTGAIISSSYPSLQSSVTDSQLLFLGGNGTNVGAGAKFTLYGGDHTSNAGEFLLQAGKPNGSSATYSQLIGKPDGTLTWGGKDVLTELNGRVVVETWKSSDGKSWYRKWSDGWIEQGGEQEAGTVTFPTAFSNTKYTMTALSVMMNADAGSIDICYTFKTTTSISIQLRYRGTAQGGFSFMWYACGF